MSTPIEIYSDLSENLNYNLPDFPLYARKNELHSYGYCASCHWHTDLEFIHILDGSMDFFVNGEVTRLQAGDGIFVNSKRLHYGFSEQKIDCTFIALIISPNLISANFDMMNQYITTKFGQSCDDYIFLNHKIDSHHKMLSKITELYEMLQCNNNTSMSTSMPSTIPSIRINTEVAHIQTTAAATTTTPTSSPSLATQNPLQMLAKSVSLCADISEHLHQIPTNSDVNHIQSLIWKMTGFIHNHYAEKITLEDIAESGAVCRSRCCKLFNQYVRQTPNNYLNKYRITKSCELLRDTKRTILEIATMCGFQNPSYFSYLFRNEMSLSPNEYRRQ
ncbi:MAG: AraC family transcriptional regulator [Clostridiales Family XIII bacterium]|jgi:YesN/AraC family two-component response regulator|nr:AraC family transcriptional regulator [Clostridiales Family XIII bacterium]